MGKTEQFLREMDAILDELLDNAEQLIEVSKSAIVEEELHELQEAQEELVQQLLTIDEELTAARSGAKSSPRGDVWQGITEKLDTFQNLNKTFIDNLTVRQGLVKFELKDVKKVRQSIKEMRSGYGARKSTLSSNVRSKSKVDHLR